MQDSNEAEFFRPLDEISEFFRVHEWKAGRVLTDADIADLQKVLADYNDEIASAVNAYHEARDDVLREIGGEELRQAAEAADNWQSAVSMERALTHYHRKAAEFEAKAKSTPSA
jgi:hypothetical protein